MKQEKAKKKCTNTKDPSESFDSNNENEKKKTLTFFNFTIQKYNNIKLFKF